MKINKSLKLSLTQDWLGLFPEMGLYEPMWLARRIGPLIQGILLKPTQGNESYCPTVHLHALTRPTGFITIGLGQPLLTERTQAHDSLKLLHHEKNFHSAALRLRRESLLPLEGDLGLDQVLKAYIEHESVGFAQNKYPILHFESSISLLSWAGRIDEGRDFLDQCVERMRTWPDLVMASHGGPDAWGHQMLQVLGNPEDVHAIANQQAEALDVCHLSVWQLNIR
ncbi:hypothetical protein [Mitsuaria sp. 7]|uniref:hypothetical protein n=1 Tax=Mitsuaria sp. 7 TaxID=1658665 RepID=UPI0012F8A241|nr:hypothetical protein [Mitsuaria sp. 7]